MKAERGRTLRLPLDFLRNLECFTRMDDVDDRAGSRGFEVFEEYAGVTAVCVWRVDAFCGEVVEFLEICVPREQVDFVNVDSERSG